MADTTSIASRMEKLAKLKRMKEGLSSEPPAASPQAAPEAEDAFGPDEGFENFSEAATDSPAEQVVSAEPTFPAEADLSVPEEFPHPGELSETPELLEDPVADFDPASGLDEEIQSMAPSLDNATTDDDDVPAPAADSADDTVNFIMESPEGPSASETTVPEEAFGDDADFAQAFDAQDKSSKGLSAEALGVDDEAMADFDEIAAMAGVGGVAATAAAVSTGRDDDDPIDSIKEAQQPDFSTEDIDAEALKREFEDEAALESSVEDFEADENVTDSVAAEDADGRITISFDESRSTLLNHVSRQMSCSVDDVVVTALDWYLDALFGEDEEAKSA